MSSFVPVCAVDQFESKPRRVVDLGDREVLVLKVRDRYYAISNICTCPGFVVGHTRPGDDEDRLTHGGRLSRLQTGRLESTTIQCPAHRSVYDLNSGRPVHGMAEISLATFDTRIENGDLMVSRWSRHEQHSQ